MKALEQVLDTPHPRRRFFCGRETLRIEISSVSSETGELVLTRLITYGEIADSAAFARSDQALDVFGYYGAVRSDAYPRQGDIDEILGLAEKEPETLLLFSGLKVGRSAGLLAFDVVQVAGIQLLAQLLDALLRLITKV